VHYKPIFEFSHYRKLGFKSHETPNAASVWKRVVSLPIFPGLKDAQVDQVCDAIRRIVRKQAR
jgi:dTDP-4-amino-4,6-dideoxygalactose transaminase